MTVTVWLVLSVFLIALQCNLSRPWIFMDPHCTDAVRLFPFLLSGVASVGLNPS